MASSVSSMFTSRSKSSSASDARWYGDYVLFSLVERAGEKVIEIQDEKMGLGSPADALYTFESFRKEFACCVGSEEEADSGSGSMSELDMKVLLRYLEREKGVVVVDNGVRFQKLSSFGLFCVFTSIHLDRSSSSSILIAKLRQK